MPLTDAQLTVLAEEIRDETTPGENTALRVYTILKEIIDAKGNVGTGIPVSLMGYYNASSGLYPGPGLGSGVSGAIRRGDTFDISVASPEDVNENIKFPVGATIRALTDAPGQVDASWKITYA